MSKSEKLMIFDDVAGQVIHACEDVAWTPGWLSCRQTIGQFLPVAAFTVDESRNLITEEWVEGRPLAIVDSVSRIRIVEELLERMRSMAASEATVAAGSFWESIDFARQCRLIPADARRFLTAGWQRIRSGVDAMGFMPAHGDLSGNNMLVSDRTWRIIDLDDCRELPVYYDLYFLAHQELLAGRDDIWNWLFLDGSARRMDKAVGKQDLFAESLMLAEWLGMMFLVECYLEQLNASAAARREESYSRSWRPIAELLSASRSA